MTKDFVKLGGMRPAPPTPAELEILRVIWDRGPSTVREVYRTLSREREIGYSTVLKFMQIMTEKGTLLRDETVRPQVYRPAHRQADMQRGLLSDMVERVFGGSAASLVMHALADRKSSKDERRQIRALLDDMERPRAKNTKPQRRT